MRFKNEAEENLNHEAAHMAVALMHNLNISETHFFADKQSDLAVADVYIDDSGDPEIEARISLAPLAIESAPSSTDLRVGDTVSARAWVMEHRYEIAFTTRRIVKTLKYMNFNYNITIKDTSAYLRMAGIEGGL
jgi:hypothetical protein